MDANLPALACVLDAVLSYDLPVSLSFLWVVEDYCHRKSVIQPAIEVSSITIVDDPLIIRLPE